MCCRGWNAWAGLPDAAPGKMGKIDWKRTEVGRNRREPLDCGCVFCALSVHEFHPRGIIGIIFSVEPGLACVPARACFEKCVDDRAGCQGASSAPVCVRLFCFRMLLAEELRTLVLISMRCAASLARWGVLACVGTAFPSVGVRAEPIGKRRPASAGCKRMSFC